MNKLFLLPLLAASSLPSWGATVNSNTFFFSYGSASHDLGFNKFDTALGTLTMVEILLLPGSTTVMSGTPTNVVNGGCGGNYNYTRSVTAGGVVTSVGSVFGSLFSSSCGSPDSNVHSLQSQRTISNATNLNLFEGTGTVNVNLGRGALSVAGIDNPGVTFDGYAQLRYTYDAAPTVPEPGTWGLLGTGLLAGFLGRRFGISRSRQSQ